MANGTCRVNRLPLRSVLSSLPESAGSGAASPNQMAQTQMAQVKVARVKVANQNAEKSNVEGPQRTAEQLTR